MPATATAPGKPDTAPRPSTTNAQNNAPQQSTSGGSTPNNGTTSNAAGAPKANRPSDSRFKQQKLKAWQPILTAGTVLPTFFVIGLVFIPIGVLLFITSKNVQEHVFDYTDDCVSKDEAVFGIPCKDVIKNESLKTLLKGEDCHCEIRINIKDDVAKPVFIYYGLTNFYQNHRRYVKSRDDVQLLGDYKHTTLDCQPFQENANRTPIYPCGAVANSMFNDSFVLAREIYGETDDNTVAIQYTDIAWKSDRDKKFFNPAQGWPDEVKNEVIKPPYWKHGIWDFSKNPLENGVKNESFIVWMRTAALPTFRKLHSRVDHEIKTYADGLPAGNYTVRIAYNYPVDSFDGRKRFIISNTSWAGGKNPFLGVAYIVVGSLCILTGFIFLLIHVKFGKSLTELASVN